MTKFCTKNLSFESDNKHFDLIINASCNPHTYNPYSGTQLRCFNEPVIGTIILTKNKIELNDLELQANPNFPYESATTSGNGWGIMLHFHMPYYEFTAHDLVSNSNNDCSESII